MTDDKYPAPKDRSDKNKYGVPIIARKIDELLRCEMDESLSDHDQGVMIMDQFIGMVVRQGAITDSRGDQQTPEVTFKMINQYGKGQSDSRQINYFTSAKGLRYAVNALADDPRTGELFYDFEAQLVHKDQDGQLILGSMNQIEGYLQANPQADSAINKQHPSYINNWQTILNEAIAKVVEKGRIWQYDPYEGRIESDVDSIRQEGIKWSKTIFTARSAGIDTTLLGKSAERVRQRNISGQHIAAHVLKTPNRASDS